MLRRIAGHHLFECSLAQAFQDFDLVPFLRGLFAQQPDGRLERCFQRSRYADPISRPDRLGGHGLIDTQNWKVVDLPRNGNRRANRRARHQDCIRAAVVSRADQIDQPPRGRFRQMARLDGVLDHTLVHHMKTFGSGEFLTSKLCKRGTQYVTGVDECKGERHQIGRSSKVPNTSSREQAHEPARAWFCYAELW
jgi:hypothetical protein